MKGYACVYQSGHFPLDGESQGYIIFEKCHLRLIAEVGGEK